MTRVLLIGSGGREHALAWKLSQSPRLAKLIAAPGGDAWAPEWERWPCELGKGRAEFERLAGLARHAGVGLVVVGPDNPLADGIADVFEAAGIPVFGPSAKAAQLEASKVFAKEVMGAAGVPTARHFVAGGPAEAGHVLRERCDWSGGRGWVVKVDGLALGKGVEVCGSLEQALGAVERLDALMGAGAAGGRMVIEERLPGEELSVLAFCDGKRAALMQPVRDHKRVGDGDQGPNTGGMGAFSPVPGVPAGFLDRLEREVFQPTLREMDRRGSPFRGVLYAGVLADFARDTYGVLEFNARFGDPETQVLMALMEGDLLDWCLACARSDLGSLPSRVPFRAEAALVVVGAAGGYPESPEKGRPIEGPVDHAPDYFCAGVAGSAEAGFRTSGGRVFGAMGVGATLAEARTQAYQRLKQVRFEGLHFRSDIAGSAGGGER